MASGNGRFTSERAKQISANRDLKQMAQKMLDGKRRKKKIRAEAAKIVYEDDKRLRSRNDKFDPISGFGSPPYQRFEFSIEDVHWYLPVAMKKIKLIKELMRLGSIEKFCWEYEMKGKEDFCRLQLIKLRCKHDFAYWAASFVTIKSKQGGRDVRFVLNRPQRLVLVELEKMRMAKLPIRMIILKARQWGGSTLVQMYMAWIQLVHKEGWYSAIVAHQSSSALNIRTMYQKMIKNYPPSLLDLPSATPMALTPYGGSRTDVTISQGKKQVRDTVISVGSMQSPESVRGADISLAHFSEVGLWRQTEGKTPEDVIQAVSSSILDAPLTMDVMESTAKGENNLFHHEWLDAKNGDSKRVPVFIPWYEIELYSRPFKDEAELKQFAFTLVERKGQESASSLREEPGAYLWGLWEKGATLENLNWYVDKRRTYRSHDTMASEFPSDDVEAFAHSGQNIFDRYKVEQLRATCCSPKWLGEIRGWDVQGPKSLKGLKFVSDTQGQLRIWEMPDRSFKASNRYLVSTDVGGRSDRADYSVIVVIDRWWRTEGEGDVIVAEWHGHIRHDLLAWKMAQIAQFYNEALLVVESNTFETKDNDTEGEHSQFILDRIGTTYRNMYAREVPKDRIKQGGRSRLWGFQTNVHTKALIIDNLISIIDDRLYTEREEGALMEYNVYQRDDKGGMNAAEGYHDDRLMARAIGLYISQGMPIPKAGGLKDKRYIFKKRNTINESTF